MTVNPFAPTHLITHDADTFPVMCVPDDDPEWLPCFTQDEWDSYDHADYEYHENDGLLFRGACPPDEWSIIPLAEEDGDGRDDADADTDRDDGPEDADPDRVDVAPPE